MTTRETLVRELEQLNTSIDFNSKQGLKLLSEYANVGVVVANKETIFFEDDHARLVRRRDAILRSLRSDPRVASAGTSKTCYETQCSEAAHQWANFRRRRPIHQ